MLDRKFSYIDVVVIAVERKILRRKTVNKELKGLELLENSRTDKLPHFLYKRRKGINKTKLITVPMIKEIIPETAERPFSDFTVSAIVEKTCETVKILAASIHEILTFLVVIIHHPF